MELSQVRAFVAVSRAGTVAGAAQELHLTSSPLSRTIRDLERQLGSDLFARRYHQFERTEFGDRFLPLAVEVVAQSDELAALGSEPVRRPRVGATPWTSKALIERLNQRASEVAPGGVDIVSDLSSVLLHQLRHGDLDLALVHLPVDMPGIAELPLARYEYGVLTTPQHDLPADRDLTLSDLSGHSLLTMPLMMQPRPMGALMTSLRGAGVEAITEIDLRDVIGLQARLERTGELMLYSPGEHLPTRRFIDMDNLTLLPIADGEIDFQVGLAWRERDALHRDWIEQVVSGLAPAADALPVL